MASTSILRKAAVLIAGSGVYGTTAYFTYLYLQRDKQAITTENNSNFSYVLNPARTEQFQRIADRYDDEIGRDEFFMGLNLLRRALLLFHAKGTCLEVGAGTARNLPYYRLKSNVVHRVVLADLSDNMLQQAKEKVKNLPPEKRSRFAFLQADAAKLDLPDNAFDTVIDTFGLCSFHDPEVVLREMARVCKPNGKILLLEHGRSHSWDFVAKHLDKHAEQHACNWGCVWNRDLDALLEKVGDSMEVQVLSRYHFGTTYYVVCRPLKENSR
jgi:methyltransferase OMS1